MDYYASYKNSKAPSLLRHGNQFLSEGIKKEEKMLK